MSGKGKSQKVDAGSPFFALKDIRDRMQKEEEAAKAAAIEKMSASGKGNAGAKRNAGGAGSGLGNSGKTSSKKPGTIEEHNDRSRAFIA